jgi:uracil-DNA glycosylase family 4
MAETDPQEILAQARRYAEDLTLFEGRHFIVPEEVVEQASGLGEKETPTSEDTSAAEPAERESVVASDEGLTLDAFREEICTCTRCPLGATRNQFVFGSGDPNAGIMFVGEAPGADEDQSGLPFVGAAGQLLTKIIEAMGLSREEVYICNILKCRPPGNRDPQPEEIAQCEPYLKRQIDLVQPRVLCTLGRFAAQTLLRSDLTMGRLRQREHRYEGIPLVATYHPAALLRNPQWKRPTWEDIKKVRRLYDGVAL